MREILSRGKRKDNGEWIYWNIYGELCRLSGKRARLAIPKTAGESYYHYIYQIRQLILPESISEFSGLTDKNGKRIFEGDIHERENHFFIAKYGKYKDCETNEDGYGWYFEYTHRKKCEGFCGDEERYVNIIGNIHDNPELLGGC